MKRALIAPVVAASLAIASTRCVSVTPLDPGAERVNLTRSFDNEKSTFLPDPFVGRCALVDSFRNTTGASGPGGDALDDNGLKNAAARRRADSIYLFLDGSQLIKGTLHDFYSFANVNFPGHYNSGEAVAQNENGATYHIPFYRGDARLYDCSRATQ